ncbi:hypothetical protein AKJ09_05953 [Labilithrix luteola]|uniref:TolB protein n=1 Tax=Labilithrix luteola TaxID=1391654 RepID=A0A0K1Q1L2_9BACT|nr:hypothetical protein AKJ09_05953 [Labilithrix luteola]
MLGIVTAAVQAGCGSDGDGSTFPHPGPDEAGSNEPTGTFDPTGGDGSASDADPDALGALILDPPQAEIAVTIVNGTVTVNAPVTFKASYNGQQVPATWLFDRGELGAVDNGGVFTASGKNVGEGIVTARYGAREGNAKVKVTITNTQNGGPAGQPTTGGFGGLGGVGGEPLGVGLSDADVAKLKGTGTAVPTSELDFLYPYDKTVWPRGLLPPLVMWETTHDNAAGVYVKLSQSNFTFEGTYALTKTNNDPATLKRVRIDDAAWAAATSGNQGDDLKLEVKILAGGTVYGPITRTWKVAAGVLKGTVYYNSYDSHFTTATSGGAPIGAVIAIKPRDPNPSLAIESQRGQCHVCHSVSADGSTLWAQDGFEDKNPPSNYARGASYSLTDTTKPRTVYDGISDPTQDRKFVWSAPYPDGSFALASSRFAREAYTAGDSKLFKRSDGKEIPAPTFSNAVQSAVTPAFAPDGRKVVFNFWEGNASAGVAPGAGRTLAVFDFTCGAPAGSTTCAANGPYAFSGLREIYRAPVPADPNGVQAYPAWPSFLPDGKAVIFHNTVNHPLCGNWGAKPDPDGTYTPLRDKTNNCQISTWYSAQGELWIAKDAASQAAVRLDNANGIGGPKNTLHPDDSRLSYQPTVNPVASGGYYWVVFTSRRMYGNLLTGEPWGAKGDGGGKQKKLWVAAIDANAGTVVGDPSHPGFYLPGQELEAGNARGFWAVDPCKQNGSSCESGDECCNGFCRDSGNGSGLVCQDKPPGATCVQEFEKCSVDADCCDPKQKCIAGKCALKAPGPK